VIFNLLALAQQAIEAVLARQVRELPLLGALPLPRGDGRARPLRVAIEARRRGVFPLALALGAAAAAPDAAVLGRVGVQRRTAVDAAVRRRSRRWRAR